MFEFKVNGINIIIELDNGIYVLGGNSAEGKTYLHDLLSVKSREDVRILTVTYEDIFKYEEMVIKKLYSGEYYLIFLDRYDLYQDKLDKEKLLNLGKDSVILYDCKANSLIVPDSDVADIYLDKDKIEVY